MPDGYARPTDILLPYQKAWVEAGRTNRFMFVLQARQTGKSFQLAAEAIEDAWVTGQDWICLSSGERASEEWLRKAEKYARWVKAFDPRLGYTYKSDQITLSNGARVTALPAKPETARGFSGNLILDEFSAHQDQEEIWAAAYPFITNGLAGEKKLRIAGTPIGKQNLFWKLWETNRSFHKVRLDIHDCVSQGLDVDVAGIQAGLGDDDIFAQEYLLQPLEANTALFTFALLQGTLVDGIPARAGYKVYIGVDVGRYHDHTSIVTLLLDQAAGHVYVADVRELANAEYVEQNRVITDIVRSIRPAKVTIDAAGIGSQLAEDLQRVHGGIIVPYTATNQSKVDGWNGVKRLMSQGRFHIQAGKTGDRIVSQLLSIRRVVAGNSMRYDYPRDGSGHVDIGSALQIGALGILADIETPVFLPIAF